MQKLLKNIEYLAKQINRNVQLMEVCGSHTQAISRYGIRNILPKNIILISGPGCPVCVTSQGDIDAIVYLAKNNIPIATYGDVLRVPGYYGSLDMARERGAKVFDVYSTEDALKLKDKYPDLVFFGLGFDTTAPMSAYAIKKGLTVYSTHKVFLPAMEALLEMGEIKIDGFIDPGHVSAIVGTEPYKSMRVSQVITGFEAEDVLVGIYMLLKQIKENRAEVENQYLRCVKKQGNKKARELIFDVFQISDGDWRGFGIISNSGLEIKSKYKEFNAKIKYKDIIDKSKVESRKSKVGIGCACGEIIRGLKSPQECPMFGRACNPNNPIGPCMVSVEGACNVSFRYAK